jgi:hypothetical protein
MKVMFIIIEIFFVEYYIYAKLPQASVTLADFSFPV